MDTLESMRAFVRVVELGSFAGAARSLDMSPAMVTKHVAHLEGRTGALLLHRTTRQVRPTEVGQAYFERCLTLLSDLEAAESEASAEVGAPRGILKVTAPVEFGNVHIAPLIGEFLSTYPEIDLNLDFANRVVNVVEEGYDVAIRVAKSIDSTLIGRRIAVSHFHIIASPDYIRHQGRPETPDDLARHPCLSFGVPTPWDEWTFTKGNVTRRIKVRNKLVSSSSETLRLAALTGAGISYLPTFVCGQDLRDGKLVSLFPDYHTGALEIYALHPHRRFVPTKVKAFISFLIKHLNAGNVEDPWN